MAYQQKLGDIAVFQEKDKKSERAPDWRGSLVVPDGAKPGDKLDVAFWTKSPTMLAGSVQLPRERKDAVAVEAQNQSRRDDPSYMVAGRGGTRIDRQAAQMIGDTSDIDDAIPF